MSTFTECDRCGAKINHVSLQEKYVVLLKLTPEEANILTPFSSHELEDEKDEKAYPSECRLDLCPKCMESLDRWMKGEKE